MRSRPHSRRTLPTLTAVLGLSAAAASSGFAIDFGIPSLFKKNGDGLEQVEQAPSGPGGLTITPSGDYIISCHQFFNPTYAVLRLNRDGVWEPFPNLSFNTPGPGNPLALDSVLGIACDANGIVWMLDNGRRSGTPPKLIGWDTTKGKTGGLHQSIYLVAPTVLRTSFVRNLAIDPEEPFIYLSDPASGTDAAIIVVELTTGLTRRVLQGHYSVIPDARIQLNLDGKPVEARSTDGRPVQPLAGVSPIMVDRKGQWLYFAPMHGGTLYRVQTQWLRDPSLDPVQLESKVQSFSVKPICDSIIMDARNNIYFGDIGGNAIGYSTPDENYLKYHYLIQDGRLIWPGGLTFGTDGKLHFFSNQLHRTPIYNSGKDVTAPPFEIFRVKPLPGKGLWPVN
ncbi:MAG: hypothetical protein KDM64_07445 [Verrucomicrobiae bacterium]|nr:hypothetical protein [Verrucomicrobiae bacterium]